MEHQRFGKHILLERIAAGGMAEVFKAKAFGVEGFEKMVAIKRILPHVASDKAFIEMFINEAKILSALSHSSVCQIFDLGQIEGTYFITMEYVAGKSLEKILQLFRKHGRTMPLTMAAFIVSRVCEGLDYVYHKVGVRGEPLRIVHRDISPHNVLVGFEGTVKVIDFGIAHAKAPKGEQPATLSQQLQGKFDYMSPEQVAGDNVDHRSDVFSIGVCLYELVTNRHPFTGNTEFNTLENIRKLTPPSPSTINADCPPDLDAMILKALEKMPSKRWERTGDLMEALQRFIISKPPLFNATSLSQFMRRTFARDIEDERKKAEAFASVKLEGSGDEAPTTPGLSEDVIAHMAAAQRAAAQSRTPAASPAAPAGRGAPKRTLIGMPAVGASGGPAPPPRPTVPPLRPVAKPLPAPPSAPPAAPPRPTIPPISPGVPRRPTGSGPVATPIARPAPTAPPGPAAAGADVGKAATLMALPTSGAGEAKVVAIPTKPGFPAVHGDVPAPPMPDESELDFDDDEAPTAVLDDKLASIVRTLAGVEPGAKSSSVPPPLPLGGPGGGGDIGASMPVPFSRAPEVPSDVYQVEPVAKKGAVAGPVIARPVARKRPWLLVLVLALAVAVTGSVAYFLLIRGGATPSSGAVADVGVVAAADTAAAGSDDAGTTAEADKGTEPDADAKAGDAAPDRAADAPAEEDDVAEAGTPEEEAGPDVEPDAGKEPDVEPDAGPAEEPDEGTAKPADAEEPRDTREPPPRRDTSSRRDRGGEPRDTAREPRDTSPPPPPPPPSDTGKLSVIANPWAWVTIDGRATGRKTALVNYEISAGIHRVCLECGECGADVEQYCTAVRIEPGRTARVVHNF